MRSRLLVAVLALAALAALGGLWPQPAGASGPYDDSKVTRSATADVLGGSAEADGSADRTTGAVRATARATSSSPAALGVACAGGFFGQICVGGSRATTSASVMRAFAVQPGTHVVAMASFEEVRLAASVILKPGPRRGSSTSRAQASAYLFVAHCDQSCTPLARTGTDCYAAFSTPSGPDSCGLEGGFSLSVGLTVNEPGILQVWAGVLADTTGDGGSSSDASAEATVADIALRAA